MQKPGFDSESDERMREKFFNMKLGNERLSDNFFNESSDKLEGPPIKEEVSDLYEEIQKEIKIQDSVMTPQRSQSSRMYYQRGPYRSYSREEKEAVVNELNSGVGITKVSQVFGIPCKNIKRWSQEGIERKCGAGRKRRNPAMEEKLNKWILQTYHVESCIPIEDIQRVALYFAKDPSFKASRGWVIKFIERYSLKDFYTFN